MAGSYRWTNWAAEPHRHRATRRIRSGKEAIGGHGFPPQGALARAADRDRWDAVQKSTRYSR